MLAGGLFGRVTRMPVSRAHAAREGLARRLTAVRRAARCGAGLPGVCFGDPIRRERPQRRSPARVLSLQPRQAGSMRRGRRRFPRARIGRRRASASGAVSGRRVRALRRRAPRAASLESLNPPNTGCQQKREEASGNSRCGACRSHSRRSRTRWTVVTARRSRTPVGGVRRVLRRPSLDEPRRGEQHRRLRRGRARTAVSASASRRLDGTVLSKIATGGWQGQLTAG